jgi:N-acetylglucosamine-6-phosphate deacetylase
MLTARQLLSTEAPIDHPQIEVDGEGLIQKITPGAPTADDTTLTPTFFDIHTHGAANHDVMEATPEALRVVGRYLATRGVSHYLATTVTAPIDLTLRSLEGLAKIIETPAPHNQAVPVGIHLEGPFISHAKRGMHPPAEIQPPSIELFDRLQSAANGHIRLITIAPETPASDGKDSAIDLIRHCAQHSVKVSIGHTNALAAETRAAIAAGAASATHTFNAMRALDHREPGVLGIVLDTQSLFAELICDGIHVAPELVRLWLKAKTESYGILVTDSISATGMPEGLYTLGGTTVEVRDGRCLLASDLARNVATLAGSVLTMDRAVANLQAFTSAPLSTAMRLASTNPARMLGLEYLVELSPSRPASFNRFDPSGRLIQTILFGKAISA